MPTKKPKESANDLRPIRVGISACLLGHQVRYDGGHKHDHFLSDTLGELFEWIPVCPEVELGLGVPRPTLRLERHGDEVRMLMPSESKDYTAAMRAYSERRVDSLAGENLSGFVLKSRSPSCGVRGVKVHLPGGDDPESRDGVGLFACVLQARLPDLPVEEETRLGDPLLREQWIARVIAYHQLQRGRPAPT
jgi:uncharacterized protein YbbK (DUF523 family)